MKKVRNSQATILVLKWVKHSFLGKYLEYLERKYLGNVISKNSYWDNSLNIEALEKLRESQDKIRDFQKMLDFLGYFRHLICDFLRKAKPLHETYRSLPESSWNLKRCSKKSKGQWLSNGSPILRKNIL